MTTMTTTTGNDNNVVDDDDDRLQALRWVLNIQNRRHKLQISAHESMIQTKLTVSAAYLIMLE